MTQTPKPNNEKKAASPAQPEEAAFSDNPSMGSRFRELLGILRRHDLIRGLTPEKLRAVLEDMGPTFIKLGQIMSMHPDILPREYCQELSKLLADVRPLPFAQIQQVLEEEYKLPLQEVFAHVEREPLGCASIAQVHKAVLPDGRQVVLKVQRPGIQQLMANDILLLRKAAGFLKLLGGADGQPVDLDMVLTEMWAVAQEEMNFLKEAGNLLEFEELNRGIAYIAAPKLEKDLSTGKILVMEYIEGIPIDQIQTLEAMGYDMTEIGEKLADNYCKQIFDDAFFHADPHPGNIWIRDGKIVWLDFGMMGRLTARDKGLFRQAIAALANRDVYELKNVILTLGAVKGKVNHTRLYTDLDDFVTRYGDLDLGSLNMGQMLEELMDLAKTNGISLPAGLSMLGRGVMTIEGVITACCPHVSVIQIIVNHLAGGMKDNLDFKQAGASLWKALQGFLSKGVSVPAQFSDVLRMAAKGQTKLNLEIVGSEEPLKKIDRMVNKLALCIITAGLTVGSSLLCTLQIEPKWGGIPWPAGVGYLLSLLFLGKLLWDMYQRKRK